MSASLKRAAAAQDAIRTLVYAMGTDEFSQPEDVDVMLASVEAIVSGLSPLLSRAQLWLGGERRAGRVGHEHPGADLPSLMSSLSDDLHFTQERLRLAATDLAHARAISAHLTVVTPARRDASGGVR